MNLLEENLESRNRFSGTIAEDNTGINDSTGINDNIRVNDNAGMNCKSSVSLCCVKNLSNVTTIQGSEAGNKSSCTTVDDISLKISVDEDTDNVLNEGAKNEASAEDLPNENGNKVEELDGEIIPETESVPVQDVKRSNDVNNLPSSSTNKNESPCDTETTPKPRKSKHVCIIL